MCISCISNLGWLTAPAQRCSRSMRLCVQNTMDPSTRIGLSSCLDSPLLNPLFGCTHNSQWQNSPCKLKVCVTMAMKECKAASSLQSTFAAMFGCFGRESLRLRVFYGVCTILHARIHIAFFAVLTSMQVQTFSVDMAVGATCMALLLILYQAQDHQLQM